MTKKLLIIPARGNSKRIKNKNIKKFCGKPIIFYSIKSAIRSKLFDTIHVSTDSKKTFKIVNKIKKGICFKRNKNLAKDTTPLIQVFNYIVESYKKKNIFYDEIWFINPCSPLITFNDLKKASNLYKKQKNNSLLSVSKYSPPIDWAFKRRKNTLLPLSPVNQITPEGLPVLFIQDIPPTSSIDLKIDQPEIYFGELSNDHVFVNTGAKEFDYPAGEQNVYKNYKGTGGVKIDSISRKALLAVRFKTMKILFSDDITSESSVLMYRNITQRILKIAPFIELDRDPYLVISQGKLFWMCDAYTISSRFPYSQSIQNLGNYIRNSVKIVIDAYNGNMDFYISDPSDPIIATYKNAFPGLFKNLADMSTDLKNHIRYPKDLFSIQTLVFTTYHMKTPQVFYNKEDQWEVPEIDNKSMQPYYTIMKLPGGEEEEYILMLPFTPRGKSNLSAWMIARSDGENYGKLGVYTFPKQRLVYGPNQIVARINQDAEVSRQISLWDQRGSSVIQGNLLVIPIEESLIYVRPLYLKADAGKIPELKRVIVGYEDQIAMERTLNMALQKLFSGLESNQDQKQSLAKLEKSLAKNNKPVILKRSDYLVIKSYFRKALESQKKLENSLKAYNEDLEGIAKVLESAEIGMVRESKQNKELGPISK